jgi:hypothetical protein
VKREQKYTDYIGKLEAKLVQQAKVMLSWTKMQRDSAGLAHKMAPDNLETTNNKNNGDISAVKSRAMSPAADAAGTASRAKSQDFEQVD